MRHLRFFFLLLPLILCSLVSCHKDEDPVADTLPYDRTVLVYMIAQNSLGTGGFSRADSTEIMAGRTYLRSGQCLLLFVDGMGGPVLYRIRRDRDRPEVLKRWAKDFSSTDPERMREVLGEVKGRCPAREYGLVMWSHADGWIPPTDTVYQARRRPLSFGIDCGSDRSKMVRNVGTQMSIEGLARAIDGAGLHLRFLFFDACLMQGFETAYALRHVTDYVVGAPIATPGAGSNYTHDLRDGFFAADPAAIARTYLADVSADEGGAYADYGLVISCLKTSALEPLAAALRTELQRSSLMGHGTPDLSGVLPYHVYTSTYYYRPESLDALQALRTILPADGYARIKPLLDAAVTYRGATQRVWVGPWSSMFQTIPVTTGDYLGVSLFLPQLQYTAHAAECPYGDLNVAWKRTEWYRAAGFAQTGW